MTLQVQRRREERELEQAARAEELDRVRLEKEREMFKEWQDQEGQVSFRSLKFLYYIHLTDYLSSFLFVFFTIVKITSRMTT